MVLPSQFQPTTDEDTTRVTIEMVPGTTIEQTEDAADQVTAVLKDQPEVGRILERISEGNARLFIVLKPDRTTKSYEFERRITPELQRIPDARVTFQGGGGGGTGRDISVMLTGSDPELLRRTAQTLVEQMQRVPGVVAPRIESSFQYKPSVLNSSERRGRRRSIL